MPQFHNIRTRLTDSTEYM